MAKWQPPIPAGALYSKAARAIGPALPLLAYCYDLVQRDGWLDLDLTEAAGDMEEPYPTVKRWWKVVKDGPFFCEAIDRGRRGWRVKFRPVWIDQRILSTRPMAAEPSSTTQGSEMILEGQKEETQELEGNFKDISRTNEGSEMILENNVYGTQDSYQADIAARAKSAPALPASQGRKPPDRTPEQQAYLDRKKAIEQAYVAELGYTPAAFGKEAKSSKWLAEHGYTPEQVVKCYRHLLNDDFYAKQHISLATISKQIGVVVRARNGTNGHHAADLPLITATAPPTPEERRAAAERRKAILEQSRAK
jgi:hypothetical protein